MTTRSRFIDLAELGTGDNIRVDGTIVAVIAVDPAADRGHKRIRLCGGRTVIVPNGARFTRVPA